MLCRAACNDLSWPSRHLRFITTFDDLGTPGKMRVASEPKTTTLRPKKEQFSTAISSAVLCPKGANAFGNGRACELPAARMTGIIFSRLRILRPRQHKRTPLQTPAPFVTLCETFWLPRNTRLTLPPRGNRNKMRATIQHLREHRGTATQRGA